MSDGEKSTNKSAYFVAQIGHELRTPLNAIKGFGGLLQEEISGPLNEEQKLYTEKILHSADDLLRIINQILDWAKLESEDIVLEKEWISLWTIAYEMNDLFEVELKNKGITMVIEVPKEIKIYGDRGRIRQVLVNLIGNSCKFTDAGGTISLKAEVQGEQVLLKVADNGIGMSPALLENLFKPFYKGSLQKRNHEGTGLGLWISQSIMKLHGGEITVQSEEGKGTTFFLQFPLMEAHDETL